MDSITKYTPDEKVDATLKATKVMIEYMGTQKEFQMKMDSGLNYLKWMVAIGLLIFLLFIGSQIYQVMYPPSTVIDRKWINQQQKSIIIQQEALSLQRSADALINLKIQQALAIDREDIAVARVQTISIQKNSIKKDSMSDKKY